MSRTWIAAVIVVSVVLTVFGNQIASVLAPASGRILAAWIPVFGLVAIFAFAFVRARSANRTMIEGSAQLSAGRVHAALELFGKAEKIIPRNPGLRHNLALAQLYLWRVDAAIEQLERVIAQGRSGIADTRAISTPVMALSLALANRRERAEAALAQVANTPSANSPYALMAQCVLACRAGNWAAAEQLIQRREVYQFGGFFRAVSEVLEAWAVHHLRGEKLRFNRVALFNEAGPDGLRKIWPELADFAEKSG